MGRALPRRRRRWFAGSLVKTSFIAEPNSARHLCCRRGVASVALPRQPDRRRARRLSCHRQPGPAAARPQQALGAGAGRADSPLRARTSRRDHSPRHQELGRFEQIGHRITGDRKGQSNSRGVGWEYLHLAIDDHSRVACSEILPDEKRGSSLRFLFNALRFFRARASRCSVS